MALTKQRIPLKTALRLAEPIKKRLDEYTDRCEIVGSVRRESPDVGDIEFVVIPVMDKEARDLFEDTEERCFGFLKACSDIGFLKSGSLVDGKNLTYIHPYDNKVNSDCDTVQVEIYVATKENFGYIQMLRTGSADFSKRMFGSQIKKNGYLCSKGFIYRKGCNLVVPVPDERDMWPLLGIDPIMPQFRI